MYPESLRTTARRRSQPPIRRRGIAPRRDAKIPGMEPLHLPRLSSAGAIACLVIATICPCAAAHHLEYTLVTVRFDRALHCEIALRFHLAAYVFDTEPGLLPADQRDRVRGLSDRQLRSSVDQASRRLVDDLQIAFSDIDDRSRSRVVIAIGSRRDRTRVDTAPSAGSLRPYDSRPAREQRGEIVLDLEWPTVAEVRRDALARAAAPSPLVILRSTVPIDARTFSITLAPRFGNVMLQVESNGAPTNVQILRPGERSWPYLVSPVPGNTAAGAPVPGWIVVGVAYLHLGFQHIVPRGLDHILFVLGLFLLNQNVRSLLIQVTCFTIAHSVSLALSLYDLVSLSPAIVEPMIALSIVYVAIENILTPNLKPWRPAVVFLFGLLHGLGFASVLRELGVPDADAITALIGFNLGVELGQLAVIGSAFVLVGWFRERAWYRTRLLVPVSAVIAFIGVYWISQRLLDSLSASG